MESEGVQGERSDQQARGERVAEDERAAPQSAREIADEVLDDEDPRPTVEHRAWIKKDDYWRRTTYIAVTGRQTAIPPGARRLPPPRRFRKPTPVRSTLVFVLVVALIILIPFGVVVAQREAALIHLPSNIPGVTLPTPTRHATPSVTAGATVQPTATSKKK